MTTLVQYIGDANEKIISSADLAEAGITSPTLVFSHAEGDDYYKSVPDVVAMFLLAQGDFKTYDGSTLLDIFENNAAPEAAPEVLSVQVGDGEPMDGSVVLPADGSGSTPALRTLGTSPGQAMPGDDPVREEALRVTIFSDGEEAGDEVLVTDPAGQRVPVKMLPGTVLVHHEGEIKSITFAELETLLVTGGVGLAIGDLSDVDLSAAVENYVLTYVVVGGEPQLTLRPVPTFATPVTVMGGRIGVRTVELSNFSFGEAYDLTASSTTLTSRMVIADGGTPSVNLMLPSPKLGGLMILFFDAPDASAVGVELYVDGSEDSSGSFSVDPGFSFAYPIQYEFEEETFTTWEIGSVGGGGDGGGPGTPSVAEPVLIMDVDTSLLLSSHAEKTVVAEAGTVAMMVTHAELGAAPNGTRWYLCNAAPASAGIEFGVFTHEPGIEITTKDGNQGIASGGWAQLWKAADYLYVLSGDLVAMDPPATGPFLLEAMLTDEPLGLWLPGTDPDTGTLYDYSNFLVDGFPTDVGSYIDLGTEAASTEITFGEEGPYPWVPAASFGVTDQIGRVATVPSCGQSITVEGLFYPGGAGVGSTTQPIFEVRFFAPTGSGAAQLVVYHVDAGLFLAMREWTNLANFGTSTNRRQHMAWFDPVSPLPTEEWTFWSVVADFYPSLPTLDLRINGAPATIDQSGDTFTTMTLGVPDEVDAFRSTPGAPDRFAMAALFNWSLNEGQRDAHYDSLSNPPPGP